MHLQWFSPYARNQSSFLCSAGAHGSPCRDQGCTPQCCYQLYCNLPPRKFLAALSCMAYCIDNPMHQGRPAEVHTGSGPGLYKEVTNIHSQQHWIQHKLTMYVGLLKSSKDCWRGSVPPVMLHWEGKVPESAGSADYCVCTMQDGAPSPHWHTPTGTLSVDMDTRERHMAGSCCSRFHGTMAVHVMSIIIQMYCTIYTALVVPSEVSSCKCQRYICLKTSHLKTFPSISNGAEGVDWTCTEAYSLYDLDVKVTEAVGMFAKEVALSSWILSALGRLNPNSPWPCTLSTVCSTFYAQSCIMTNEL